MKKIALILAVLLLASCGLVACGGNGGGETEPGETKPEETKPAQTETEFDPIPIGSGTDFPVVGGWSTKSAMAGEIPVAAQAAFDAATANVDGVTYTLLALAATQTVAGTNYAFLAKSIPVVMNPETKLVVVLVSAPEGGDPTLVAAIPVEFSAFITGTVDFTLSPVAFGGWVPATEGGLAMLPQALASVLSQVSAQIGAAVASDATANVSVLPLAILGTQETAGTNYAVLCSVDTGAASGLFVIAVNVGLQGQYSLMSACPVDIGNLIPGDSITVR